jgi:hypothetical protein
MLVRHKVHGDRIDVDFWEDSAEYFEGFFCLKCLESFVTLIARRDALFVRFPEGDKSHSPGSRSAPWENPSI